MKLRSKMLLALLIIGLPLVAVNGWWIARQQARERQRVLDRLRQDAEEFSRIVQVFLTDLANRGRQTALHVPRPENDHLQAYLRDRLDYLRFWNTSIMGLAWADPKGEILAGEPTDLFQLGVRFAGRETLRALNSGRGWALDDLVIEENGGSARGLLRMVAQSGTGSRGVLGILFRPEVFQPLFPAGRLWARIRLADQAGRLVYATDQADPSLDDRFGWAGTPGLYEALSRHTATTYVGQIATGGEVGEWMAVHILVPQIGWVATALIPAAEAMGGSRRALYGELAIQVVLISLCTGAALILADRLSRPAARLAEAAQRLAAGDRSARVSLTGRSEMAAMGRAFDEMAIALDSSWQALKAERERAESETQRLRALIESMPAAVIVGEGNPKDKTIHLAMANRAWAELRGPTGSPPVVGPPSCELLQPDGTPLEEAELPLQRAIWLGEATREQELILRLPDGSQRVLLVNAVPFPATDGTRQAVSVMLDITGRLQAEEELKRLAADNAALYEQAAREAWMKGLLLDELNHRVRNNLAMIVGFMELQRATPAGRMIAPVLDEAIGRVKGLAIIHNVLGGPSLQTGQYEALVFRLAEQTFLQGSLADRIKLRVKKQPLRLPSRVLTALGIITNELFTNIAKHAFPDGRNGTVEVTAELAGSEVVIRIHDDGVSLPPEFLNGSGQLGLRLVRSLVEVSLKGTFTLEPNDGTTAAIHFPTPEDGAPDTESQSAEPAATPRRT